MNFQLILYIIASIMLISGSFYLNFSSGRRTQAVILAVGTLLVSVLFGLRWFSLNSPNAASAGVWPPVINSCPDYLTLTKVNGVFTCIDTIGVSQQPGMQKWTSPTQTDPKFLFNLELNKTGSERVTALCANCKTANVTWEGVWDGSVCLNIDPPRPV